jgi:nucleotidyltransferase substrate binding protein (TIGR01987 family)
MKKFIRVRSYPCQRVKMSKQDIRWRQRQQNFEKAYLHLQQAVEIAEPDIVQRAGLIQFFEMTFELAWKMVKDYLEEQGFSEVKSPRDTLKKAFEIELITAGELWLQLLQDRNLMAHTYNEETAQEVESLIRESYFPLLTDLRQTFAALQEAKDG